MPSVSKAQQRFMGLVHAYKKGEVPASQVSQAVKDAAKSMKKKSTKKFASTKHKGLPNKKKKTETKVRSLIKKMVREIIDEGKLAEGKRRQLQIPVMDKLKVDKILKKDRAKMGKDYDYGVGKGATFILDMDEKLLNKVLDIMVSNRIRVKGL